MASNAVPTPKVVPITKKQEELQRFLLEDMERASADLNEKQARLSRLGDAVIEGMEKAVKLGKITPYRAALAYGSMVSALARLETVRIHRYDRLAGTVGMFGSYEEAETEQDNVDIQTQRLAEKTVHEILTARLERDRRKAAEEAALASKRYGTDTDLGVEANA